MALKHALSILMSRFSLTYKVLLYAMLVIFIFVLIGIVVLLPIISGLTATMEDIGFFGHVKDSFMNIIQGKFEAQTELFVLLKEDVQQIGQAFSEHTLAMTGAVLWVAFVIMLFKICMTMCHYPIADVVDNFMSRNSRFGFTSNFVSNLGISAKYSLAEFIVSLPFYLLSFGVVFGIGWLLWLFSPLLAVIMGFGALIVIVALKKALLAFWLPDIVTHKDKKVWTAFKEQFAFVKEKFVKVFGLYVITNLLMFAFVAFFGLLTFSIGWYVGYALCVVLSRIIDMVIYYRHLDMKYYIEPKTVIDAKSEIM